MNSSEIQCDGNNYKSGCDEVLVVYVALNLPIIFSPDIDLNKFPCWPVPNLVNFLFKLPPCFVYFGCIYVCNCKCDF